MVVGNVTVGGTGKTPLVEALCSALVKQGVRPGIVSRGYGRHARGPMLVSTDASPTLVGDEALSLKRNTQLPLAVGADRHLAIQLLLDDKPGTIDVIIMDDGLQHFAVRPDVSIVVVDSLRQWGNAWCLPAGPLREPCPLQCLSEVDVVVINEGVVGGTDTVSDLNLPIESHRVALVPMAFVSLQNSDIRMTIDNFVEKYRGEPLHAIAGIGHPEAFFKLLEKLGLMIRRHSFPDHHIFSVSDVLFSDGRPIVMTEKDAVKCDNMTLNQPVWVLSVQMHLPESLLEKVFKCLEKIRERYDR